MARLVHLAPASACRFVEKTGVRGRAWSLLGRDGTVGLRRAIFAMPVLEDFATTHQWLREIRRGVGERLVAVHLALPREEPVYVGRFNKPHELRPLGEAIGWVRDNPAGAEIVVPRSIGRREVTAVRELTQLVGWTETPEARSHFDCVCVACLPPGSRDIRRRVRAAFAKGLASLRSARDDDATIAALQRMDGALERARGTLSPRSLLPWAKSPSAGVRRTVAWNLGYFAREMVEPTLARLLEDESDSVRSTALESLVRVAGCRRTASLVRDARAEVVEAFVDHLAAAGDATEAADKSTRLRARRARSRVDSEPPR